MILGVGAGLSFPTLSGAAVGSVPGARFAVATALNSVARQLGAALGVRVLIAILGTPAGGRAAGVRARLALRRRPASSSAPLPFSASSSGAPREGGSLAARRRPRSRPRPSIRAAQRRLDGLRASRTRTAAGRKWRCRRGGVPAQDRGLRRLLRTMRKRGRGARRGGTLALPGNRCSGKASRGALYAVRLGHLEVCERDEEAVAAQHLTRGAVLGELALLSNSSAAPRCGRCATPSSCGMERARSSRCWTPSRSSCGFTRSLSDQLQRAGRARSPARAAGDGDAASAVRVFR